jgi:DNA-binding NarL/FixJ family response regulator
MGSILIIDEEGISVRGIMYLIEKHFPNIQSHVSKTCSSGLNEIKTNDYNVVILDMMLPLGDWQMPHNKLDNLNGLNLLEEIRKIKPNLQVVCYTIVADEKLQEKISGLHAKYVCKLHENSRQDLINYIGSSLKG